MILLFYLQGNVCIQKYFLNTSSTTLTIQNMTDSRSDFQKQQFFCILFAMWIFLFELNFPLLFWTNVFVYYAYHHVWFCSIVTLDFLSHLCSDSQFMIYQIQNWGTTQITEMCLGNSSNYSLWKFSYFLLPFFHCTIGKSDYWLYVNTSKIA